ncbi:MAG TPA: hypothetical protein VME23_08845 [Terracidiphilus sp.]|nr:hypothetical protein [Terracidiphilus sp.]
MAKYAEREAAITNEVSLVSIAMLIVNESEGKSDYLDYLTPFLTSIIRDSLPHGINRYSGHEALNEVFQLDIPSSTVELCLKRLTLLGQLTSTSLYGNLSYLPTDSLVPSNIEPARQVASETLARVISSLLDFVAATYADVRWNRDNAIAAFTGYLSYFGIDCLRSYFGKCALPRIVTDKREFIIVNSFIIARQNDAEVFDDIVIFVKSQMLANALLCPDLANNSQKFSNLTIYLDTPLMLRLLNLQDEAARAAAAESIDLCRSLGAKLAIFEHTYQEMRQVILQAAASLDNPQYQVYPIYREMRKRGITSAELQLKASHLDDEYRPMGIVRLKTPEHLADFEISERLLDAALDDGISYHKEKARIYDIDSIRSIYTLRANKRPTSIEDSVAILVTTNTALARVAYKFGQKFECSMEVSTVVSSFSIANIAWLKGNMISTTLPKLESLALAYAAMQPSHHLFERFVKKADELRAKSRITPRDHAILRFSPSIHELLMKATLGDEERITDATMEQLLEEAEGELVKEERARLQAKEEELKTYVERSSAKVSQLEGRLSQSIEASQRLLLQQVKVSRLVGSLARWGSFAVFAGLYVAMFFAIGMIPGSETWKAVAKVVSTLFMIGFGIYGATPNGWSQRLGNAVTSGVRKYLLPSDPAMESDEIVLDQKLLPTELRAEEPERGASKYPSDRSVEP